MDSHSHSRRDSPSKHHKKDRHRRSRSRSHQKHRHRSYSRSSSRHNDERRRERSRDKHREHKDRSNRDRDRGQDSDPSKHRKSKKRDDSIEHSQRKPDQPSNPTTNESNPSSAVTTLAVPFGSSSSLANGPFMSSALAIPNRPVPTPSMSLPSSPPSLPVLSMPRTTEEKDPYFNDRRQIEVVRKTNPELAQKMENDLERRTILEAKEKQVEQMQKEFKFANKEAEEAKREDMTIIVYCLPLKANEQDILKFFRQANCGKVRDIRIIRDPKSQKSKGIGYVEFYTEESVEKALRMSDRPFELNGRQFTGLKVQHSQAEKNRNAAAAKQMKVTKPIDPLEHTETQRKVTKVQIGGLSGKLSEISESELQGIFEPFGPIEYVDVQRDPQTGRCKGFAFIQYTDPENAKQAAKDMKDLKLAGQKLTVQLVTGNERADTVTTSAAGGDEYLHSQANKEVLTKQLLRTGTPQSNLSRPPVSALSTQFLTLTNMFKMEGTTPAFFEDLKRQVTKQCTQFGKVEKVFIEKNNYGNVWVRFNDIASAVKAQEKLNGKTFDNAVIWAYPVTQSTYYSRVGN